MCPGFLSWIRSNDKVVIVALQSQAENLVKAAGALVELIANYENLAEKQKQIKDFEHEGDQIAHKLFNVLDELFVTPLDREDISRLTSAIDQILDYTEGTAARFVIFKIAHPTPYMLELAKLLLSASQEVSLVVSRLRELKVSKNLIEHCRNISRYEHEGDAIYRAAIALLFETDNAIEIIKQKEIYENLEGALDRCADVADVIEDIALKYG